MKARIMLFNLESHLATALCLLSLTACMGDFSSSASGNKANKNTVLSSDDSSSSSSNDANCDEDCKWEKKVEEQNITASDYSPQTLGIRPGSDPARPEIGVQWNKALFGANIQLSLSPNCTTPFYSFPAPRGMKRNWASSTVPLNPGSYNFWVSISVGDRPAICSSSALLTHIVPYSTGFKHTAPTGIMAQGEDGTYLTTVTSVSRNPTIRFQGHSFSNDTELAIYFGACTGEPVYKTPVKSQEITVKLPTNASIPELTGDRNETTNVHARILAPNSNNNSNCSTVFLGYTLTRPTVNMDNKAPTQVTQIAFDSDNDATDQPKFYVVAPAISDSASKIALFKDDDCSEMISDFILRPAGQTETYLQVREGALGFGKHRVYSKVWLGVNSSSCTPSSKAIWVADRNMIAAGELHACALNNFDWGHCWGKNDSYQTGTNRADKNITSADKAEIQSGVLDGPVRNTEGVITRPKEHFISIGTGAVHTCGLTSLGAIKCWGANTNGVLGTGVAANVKYEKPEAVTVPNSELGTNKRFVQLAVGKTTNCAIGENHILLCWGYNKWGQIGDASTKNKTVPTKVNFQIGWKQVSVGDLHTCGIGHDNKVYCWGYGANGRLGSSGTSYKTTPTPVSFGSGAQGEKFKAVYAGPEHSCAISERYINDDSTVVENKLYCWGRNNNGQLGIARTDNLVNETPIQVTGFNGNRNANDTQVLKVALGDGFTCALAKRMNGKNAVKCWGLNDQKQLGLGNKSGPVVTPQVVSALESIEVTDITAGSNFACAMHNNGAYYCWGANNEGQLLRPKSATLFDVSSLDSAVWQKAPTATSIPYLPRIGIPVSP